ncbi:hypothetical protein TNCV_4242651 [Trichonephila clavipes]|nr:hypothetical protein TNCV_4242651 [Trichonephila clavipes]
MALSGSLPQINLGVQGETQGGHHKDAADHFVLQKIQKEKVNGRSPKTNGQDVSLLLFFVRKGISGSASHPTEKGDAFPTPGRRQCTHKYIMVWDVLGNFPRFGGVMDREKISLR